METLLPCPFCGGDDFDVDIDSRDRSSTSFRTHCTKCDSSGPSAITLDGMRELWNTRASADAAHRAREEAVRELVVTDAMVEAACRAHCLYDYEDKVWPDDFDCGVGEFGWHLRKQARKSIKAALEALTHPAHSDAGASSGEE